MDFSILQIIFTVAITVGLVFGYGYIKVKYPKYFTDKDIEMVMKIFKVTRDVVDELNLKHEPEIEKIANAVADALDLLKRLSSDGDNKQTNVFNFVCRRCEACGIKLNDKRKELIENLINLSLNK